MAGDPQGLGEPQDFVCSRNDLKGKYLSRACIINLPELRPVYGPARSQGTGKSVSEEERRRTREGTGRRSVVPSPLTLNRRLRIPATRPAQGETGSTVVFASRFTKSETDGNGHVVDRQIPFLKAYSVFNVDQIDGLSDHYYHRPETALDPIDRIDNADRFFRNTGAVIRHDGSQAYYSPVTDHIQMPPFETFRDAASYVATLSHEATHYAVSLIMPHDLFWRL